VGEHLLLFELLQVIHAVDIRERHAACTAEEKLKRTDRGYREGLTSSRSVLVQTPTYPVEFEPQVPSNSASARSQAHHRGHRVDKLHPPNASESDNTGRYSGADCAEFGEVAGIQFSCDSTLNLIGTLQ
jgi:hypothetical protein